jgi:sugar lactone lactonase YvrE
MTWVGCVVAPESATLNAVAPLPGEGFLATNPYRRTLPNARDRAIAGGESGEVWEWHTASGWTIVPDSAGPGPNGIEVSKDGKWMYVNFWPASKVMRISRGQTPAKRDVIDLNFHPDNIRWQADGSLISAGHFAPTIEKATECLRKTCPDAAARVVRINPKTMKVEELVNYPSSELFFGATAALQVGKEIWIGSVRGDRVARYPIR